MALASWSMNRIVALWIGGLFLQGLLILTPVLLARHLKASRAELMRSRPDPESRWRTSEVADFVSQARQRAESRASGDYTVTPGGDTITAVVSMPSGRPSPAVIASFHERTRRRARYVTAVLLGLVPSLLVLITLAWAMLRRREAEPSASFEIA